MVFKKFILLIFVTIQIVGQLEATKSEQRTNTDEKLEVNDLERIEMAMKVSRDCCENAKCCSRRIGKKRSFYIPESSSFSSSPSLFSQPKTKRDSSLSSSALSISGSDLVRKIFADRIKKDQLKLNTDLLLRDVLQKRFSRIIERRIQTQEESKQISKDEFRSHSEESSITRENQERLSDDHQQKSKTNNLSTLQLIQKLLNDLDSI